MQLRALNKNKKRKYSKRNKNKLPDLFMSYILLDNMNSSIKSNIKDNKKKTIREIIKDENNELIDTDLSDESITDSIEQALEEDIFIPKKDNIVEKIEIVDELEDSFSEQSLTAS